jgi:GMP synthase PP-ATPase subunit
MSVIVRSRSMANKLIADTHSTKFLGLIIDNILLRKNNLDQLMSKLSKEYYAIRAAKSFMNEKR